MTIEELINEKKELEAKLYATNKLIYQYDDGYKYVVLVFSYGSKSKHEFTNIHAADNLRNEYNQDNGFAHLYTNNPNIKDVNHISGNTYYIDDISKVTIYTASNIGEVCTDTE